MTIRPRRPGRCAVPARWGGVRRLRAPEPLGKCPRRRALDNSSGVCTRACKLQTRTVSRSERSHDPALRFRAVLRRRGHFPRRHPFMRAGTAHRLGRRGRSASCGPASATPRCRPPRTPVGPIAHEGTAPAMAGQAAQRGYEAPRERGRESSRAYVSGSRGCPSLELARSRANSRRVPSRGAAWPAIAGLPAAKRRDAMPARRGPPARGVAADGRWQATSEIRKQVA